MKVVDISEGKREIDKLFDTFESSHHFDDFLKVFEYSLKGNVKDSERLQSTWVKNEALTKSGDHLIELTNLLLRINITYPEKENEEISIPFSINAELFHKHSEMAFQAVKAMCELGKELKPFRETYAWFYPSLIFGQLLMELYPEDLDPGRKIAEYLNLLFPSSISSDQECLYVDFDHSPQYEIAYDSERYKLLDKIGEWVIRNYAEKNGQCKWLELCLRDILDPYCYRKMEHTVPLAEQLIGVIQAPREFYYLWLNRTFFLPMSYQDGNRKLTTEDFKTLLKFIPIGKNRFPLLTEKGLSDKYRKNFINLHWKHIRKIINSNYLSFGSFLSLLEMYFYYNSSENLDEEGKSLVKWVIQSLTAYRHEYFAGNSPFDVSQYAFGCDYISSSIGIENDDLLTILATANSDGGILGLAPDEIDPPFQTAMDYYNTQQNNYVVVFHKCVKEGRPELGVALLSLYIFCRAITTKAAFGNLPQLIEVIEQSLKLPGSKILKHTIEIVCGSISNFFNDDSSAKSTLRFLQQYVANESTLHVLPGGGKGKAVPLHNEADVITRLVSELGQHRWDKLNHNSQDFLITAEITWKNNAAEFGFGIKDWGWLIIQYCKAIENELVERLNDFFYSNEYLDYLLKKKHKRAAKPSAGGLLRVIRDYKYLPKNLQDMLVGLKVNLINDPGLTSTIIDLIDGYRNKSAHTDIVGMKMYADFKTKLFHDQLLHKYIDALG
jgi:hypothetical protein